MFEVWSVIFYFPDTAGSSWVSWASHSPRLVPSSLPSVPVRCCCLLLMRARLAPLQSIALNTHHRHPCLMIRRLYIPAFQPAASIRLQPQPQQHYSFSIWRADRQSRTPVEPQQVAVRAHKSRGSAAGIPIPRREGLLYMTSALIARGEPRISAYSPRGTVIVSRQSHCG